MNHIFNIYILTFIIFLLLINYKRQLDKNKRENFDLSNEVNDSVIKEIFNDMFNNMFDIDIKENVRKFNENIYLTGNITTNNKTNFPSGWSGSGCRTWDVYASGAIGFGDDNCNLRGQLNNNGSASFAGGAFEITADGQVIFRQPGNPSRFCKIYFHGETLKFETQHGNTMDFQINPCTNNMGVNYKGIRRYINGIY